eukprot:UN02326
MRKQDSETTTLGRGPVLCHNTGPLPRVVVSLSCFACTKLQMLRLLLNRGLVGSQGLKRTKNKYAQRQRLRRKSLPNVDFRLEHLYQFPKNSLFFKFNHQTSLFKLLSSPSISALLSPDCPISI